MSDALPPTEPPPKDAGIQPGLPTAPVPITPPPVREEIAYQPVSGWAVAGFAAGALFALLVVASTVVALQQGAPFFLHPAIIFIAVGGIVLSLLGQWHVQKSEGTRAGAKLARYGLWLSIVSGLCYLSYYYVTGLALESQANAFLMEKTDDETGFFPRLREGANDPVQVNAAYLLTRPDRSTRPDNETELIKLYDIPNKEGMPGELPSFKYGLSPGLNGAWTRIFHGNSAKAVEITPLAVQEWKYEQKSYQVRRNYLIKTKELNWEVTLLVQSREAEATGQGRKWFLNLNQSAAVAKELTEFGKGIFILRMAAKKDLEELIGKLNGGAELTVRNGVDQTEWSKKFGDDFADKQEAIYKLFEDKSPNRINNFMTFSNGSEVGKWDEFGDKIRVQTAFRFGLPKRLGEPAAYSVDAFAVHETVKGGINPAEIDRFAAPPAMRLVSITVTGITPAVVPQLKGGPPG